MGQAKSRYWVGGGGVKSHRNLLQFFDRKTGFSVKSGLEKEGRLILALPGHKLQSSLESHNKLPYITPFLYTHQHGRGEIEILFQCNIKILSYGLRRQAQLPCALENTVRNHGIGLLSIWQQIPVQITTLQTLLLNTTF